MSGLFKLRQNYDTVIPTVGAILSITGLVMILSSSQFAAAQNFGNAYYFFARQLFSWVIGVIAFFYFLKVPIERLYNQRSTYLIVTIILLISVLIFGPRIASVHRWIDVGFFRFQPAEFAKLFMIIYFSGWFAVKGKDISTISSGLTPFLLVMAIVGFLIIKEPDMGTMIVILTIGMVLYFVANADLLHYFGVVVLGLVCLLILVYLAPYRVERLKNYFEGQNGTQDLLGSGYQNYQAQIAVGSGGLWGVGFGQGTSKQHYLPESHTDSIFAVIAEELGFIRTAAIFSMYFIIAWRGFLIAKFANSKFVQYLAVGITTALFAQVLINVGGILHIIPLTGVPLPLISYGGSSLIITMGMLGLLTNISREIKK
ncbi:putative lipid II flippase FtsW [Candidatus Berkelbacteria bacterium]|nr:putative lipid II flippase FtsW [Candidatus Berkelbacteria bacterium]